MFWSRHYEMERANQIVGVALSSRPATGSGSGAVSWPSSVSHASLHQLLAYAGISPRGARVVGLCALLMVSAALLTLFLGYPVVAAALVVVGGVAIQGTLKKSAFTRAEGFEKDYTALLLALASSVRTGLDPLVALSNSEELFEPRSEVRKELRALREGLERGGREDGVIRSFASTIDHPDVALFRSAFLLARREGSSLAECLQRLARVTRQRQSFRRKIRGAVAMQKLSAIGIAGCTVAIGAIQALTNPAAIKAALAHPLGQRGLGLGVLLVLVGVGWMLRMGRSKI